MVDRGRRLLARMRIVVRLKCLKIAAERQAFPIKP